MTYEHSLINHSNYVDWSTNNNDSFQIAQKQSEQGFSRQRIDLLLIAMAFFFVGSKYGRSCLKHLLLNIPVIREFIPLLHVYFGIVKSLIFEYKKCDAECKERRWTAWQRFIQYVYDTGMDIEFRRGLLKFRPLLLNVLLLHRIHQFDADKKRRGAFLSHGERRSKQSNEGKTAKVGFRGWLDLVVSFGKKRSPEVEIREPDIPLPTMEETHRIMKLTTTAYGPSMANAAGLGRMQSKRNSLLFTPILNDVETLCRHNGLCNLSKDAVIIKRSNDVEYTDHILIYDHSRRQAVLSIRGTYSISDLLTDIDVVPVDFCGGSAPAGFVNMATNIWKESADAIRLVPDDYELMIIGHSLGGAIASLLTMKVLCENLLPKTKIISCHSFGSPMVFAGNDETVKRVSSHITTYVHQDDAVCFLSAFSLRQLSLEVAVIDTARQKLSWAQLVKAIFGGRPSLDLQKALANAPRLEPISDKLQFQWPVERVIWLRHADRENEYEAVVCDPKLLATRKLLLTNTMMSDHLPAMYEDAVRSLTRRAEELTCRL